ncbi:adenine nucleotide alpha hydrolases-like protein [Meredithblackwellia eburnea MCA 4105]
MPTVIPTPLKQTCDQSVPLVPAANSVQCAPSETDVAEPSPDEPLIVQDGRTGKALTAEVEAVDPGQHHYIVCLDPKDSEASMAALNYAKSRLATAGDLVVLLTVLPIMPDFVNVYAFGGGMVTDYYDEDILKKRNNYWRKQSLQHLDKLAQGFPANVNVHVRVAYGDPLSKIVEAADFHKADMIITGRRKMGKVQRFFSSGSLSTSLLTNTQYSVLVIR